MCRNESDSQPTGAESARAHKGVRHADESTAADALAAGGWQLRPAAAPSRDALNTMSLIQCDGGFFEAESCSLAGLLLCCYDGSATSSQCVLRVPVGRLPRGIPFAGHYPSPNCECSQAHMLRHSDYHRPSSDKVSTHGLPLRTCSRVKLRCSSVEISTRLQYARCMPGVCQVYVACCIRRAVVQQVASAAYRSCNFCRAWATPASRLARARSRRGGPTAIRALGGTARATEGTGLRG